jgi:hypothetical protein
LFETALEGFDLFQDSECLRDMGYIGLRVISLDLVSVNEATTGYDLFLLMLIFPVNENSALSAVELAAGFADPFRSPVNRYLSFKLCNASTSVLFEL